MDAPLPTAEHDEVSPVKRNGSVSTRHASPSAAEDERPSKRHKSRSLACRECRDRKVRCDGSRPVCETCRRKGWGRDKCIYPEADGPIASSKSYVKALQKRINELEQWQQQVEQQQHIKPFPMSQGMANADRPPLTAASSEASPSVAARASVVSVSSSRPATRKRGESLAETADRLGSAPAQNPLGQSSFAGFMAQAEEAFARHTPPPGSRPRRRDGDGAQGSSRLPPIRSLFPHLQTNKSANRQPSSACVANMMLPPRSVADDLLQGYWEWDHVTLPIVHRTLFQHRYRMLWEHTGPGNGSSPITLDTAGQYCLLAAMIAVAQLYLTPGTPDTSPESVGQSFFDRARNIIFSDLLEVGSLQAAQALLLMTRYLRRTGKFHESWVYCGMAHRIAEGLGLHLPISDASQAEREERHRTWCAAIWMSRMQNITYGHFPAGGTFKISPLPQDIDDEMMELDPSLPDKEQPPDVPSRISFFRYGLTLSDIVNFLVRVLSEPAPGQDNLMPAEDFTNTMLNLDDRLQRWHEELPDHLREFSGDLRPGGILERQYYLLRCRFLETRILIFRTELMRLARNEQAQKIVLATMLRRSLAKGMVESCLESIKEMVGLASVRKDSRLMPPKPHMICSYLIMGTIIAMVIRLPFFRQLLSGEELMSQRTQFDKCLRCLLDLDPQEFPLAAKSADILRSMLSDDAESDQQQANGNGLIGQPNQQGHILGHQQVMDPSMAEGNGMAFANGNGAGMMGPLQDPYGERTAGELDVWLSGDFADAFGFYSNLSDMGLEDLGVRSGPGNVMSFW